MGEHVLILGGGVIGLSCAYECAKRGHKVTVLEKNNCGGQASGAAAGMLAPFSENTEQPDDFFRLCLASHRLYPLWVKEIEELTKHSTEYINSGSLNVVYHQADLLSLETRLQWQRQYGVEGEILQGNNLFHKEPSLSKEIKAAVYYPQESHIYAPSYVKALEAACRKLNVDIQDHLREVEMVDPYQGITFRSEEGRLFSGDRLIVCTGAWAKELESIFGIDIPVYPIRGQICAYQTKTEVRHMVFSSQGYLVAKENGTLVCGASEDIAGFDTSVTEKGISRLEKWSPKVFPALTEKPFYSWAGLRPATQDGMPMIGSLKDAKPIIFAVGHYRNGILLSPITAKVAADLIDGLPECTPLAAFSPNRFE
jgi:glycine oxidase